jgi:hypothetical protein
MHSDYPRPVRRVPPVSRRRRRLPSNAGAAALVVVLFVLTAAVLFLFQAWLVMLAMGGLHSIWVSVPAVSFWQAAIITFALWVISGLFRGVSQ